MNPRPLIKWKSFWLGILVLGFFGWAWARSIRMEDRISFAPLAGSNSYWFDSDEGQVTLGCWWLASQTFLKHLSKPNDRQEWWQSNPLQFEAFGEQRLVRIAHWLLILLFLVPWVSFLAWRVRKQRRLTQADA